MMSAMTAPAKPSDSAADAAEVLAFLAGDEGAFERLVDRHQRPVLHLCQRLVGHEDGRDLFQDVFLQAYRALPQLRAPGAFRTWLFRITVRRARRRLLERPRPASVENPDLFTAQREADPVELDEVVARLRACLGLLPERQREVVLLRHYQELPFAEIAAILGIREDAARANHYQGLKRLRRELFGEGGASGEAEEGTGEKHPTEGKDEP
jgi:RNA polymerase sigma-70 factor (ECF subfamily)